MKIVDGKENEIQFENFHEFFCFISKQEFSASYRIIFFKLNSQRKTTMKT